jgi:ribosomal protein L12E/L44/L45/RPP1/RPP2
MALESSNWTYNEFLAFLLVYAGSMDNELTKEELAFIQNRTKISQVDKMKATVQGLNDVEVIEVIEGYRKKYLDTAEKEVQAKTDLENLLKTPGEHSQIEKVGVHMLEKIIMKKAG